MALSSSHSGGSLSEINITPLVDVMLVLLIIFMVAAPIAARTIPLDLPNHVPQAPPEPPRAVRLRISDGGELFWDGVALSPTMLEERLALEAAREAQPLLELESSPEARYEVVADVLAAARSAGLVKIGFVDMSR